MTTTRTYHRDNGECLTIEDVAMADLATGDQVIEHGGLLVELGERHVSQSHHDVDGPVIWFEGTIRNPEILTAKPWLFGGIIPLDGSRLSWTVQSADWVQWPRVCPAGAAQAEGAGEGVTR